MKTLFASLCIYLIVSTSFAVNLRAKVNAAVQVTQNDIFYLTEQIMQLHDSDFGRDLGSTILLQLKTSHEIDQVLKMLRELRDRLDQEIRFNDQEFEANSLELNEIISDMKSQQIDAQKQITSASVGLRSVSTDQDATNSIIKSDEKQLGELKRDREKIENSFGSVIADLKSRTGEQSKVIAVIDTIIKELTKRIEAQQEGADQKKADTKSDKKKDDKKKDDKKAGNSTTAADKKADASAKNATASNNSTANTTNATKTGFSEIDSKLEEIASQPYFESLAELSRLNPILALAELTTNLDVKKAQRIIKKLQEIRAMLAKNLAADKDLLSEKEAALAEALGKLGLLETSLNDELTASQAKAKRLTLEFTRLTITRDTNQKAYDQCASNISTSETRLTLITKIHDEFKRKKTSELEAVKKAIQVLSAKKNEIRVNTRTSP